MGVQRHRIAVTTSGGTVFAAQGAGTATMNYPVNGYIEEVRYGGTAFAGTATFTLTRLDDAGDGRNGGTVLAYTATGNPWQVQPRQATHMVTGQAALYAASGTAVFTRIPVDGPLKLVVSGGGSVVTDSISVYVSDS